MRLRSLGCPGCDSTNQFFLSRDRDEHLRRCSDCGGWFLVREGAGGSGPPDVAVDPLGVAPECPVEGCAETPAGDRLAAHIVEAHGESPPLRPD